MKSGLSAKSELGAGLNGWYSRFQTRLQETKIKTQKVSIMNQVGLSRAVRDGVLFIKSQSQKSFMRNEGHQHSSGNINGCFRILNLL